MNQIAMYGTLIAVHELMGLLSDRPETVVVVDCRYALGDPQWGRGEYLKGHIPGAYFADLNHDLSDPVVPGVTGRHPLPDPARFVAWVRATGISNSTQVVAYDQAGGGIAARLWWLMRWIGHEAVAVLDGGWGAWVNAGSPLDVDVPLPATSDFIAGIPENMTIDADEVQQWCNDPERTVIDSREERRYLGIEEPIDPVAGHIPGAVNLPFTENIDANGKWLSSDALRVRFEQLLANHTAEDVAFYCGSGVTACHNILAFKHAGLGDARLYPGSWSEWIADAGRDVALG